MVTLTPHQARVLGQITIDDALEEVKRGGEEERHEGERGEQDLDEG